MRRDTSLDVIRFTTLLKDGRCSEDDIRGAILSKRVKPLFHVDEFHTAFKRWAEDGCTSDDPMVFEDDDGEPYELFNGYVYLEINRALGFLDCDFHRFTMSTDVDAGLCPLPQYSLVEHVSMEDVLQQGGLTKSDAELLEKPMQRTDAKVTGSSIGPVVADSASNAPAWSVFKPQRYNGYALPLHRFLVAAHGEGNPRPTARDVVEAWRNKTPVEIALVLPDGFDYYDAKGDTKTANLDAIGKAIGRMTRARHAPGKRPVEPVSAR